MWWRAVLLFASVWAAEYTENCDDDRCVICGDATADVTSAAPRGGTITVCSTGVDTGVHSLNLKQEQSLAGPGDLRGSIGIAAPGVKIIDGLHIAGRVTVTGGNCSSLIINQVTIEQGVVVAPNGPGPVNIDASMFRNIASKAHHDGMKVVALAIAHATGTIDITCAEGTEVVMQPALKSVPFTPSYTDCEKVVDLGELFGVFGEDIERIIFDDVPPPESRFWNTYITITAAVTVAAVLLRV